MTVESSSALSEMPVEVARVFESFDEDTRPGLVALRELILDTAAETDGVGVLTETLKWGQPAYLTNETGAGSTIRIAPAGRGSNYDYAMFFICHTNLVDRFESLFGDVLVCEGNRGLLFMNGDSHPVNELRQCVAMALTYHQTKRRRHPA